MKIAILSMQRVVNFGSVLQAYSLREMIREETGATVDFLDSDGQRVLPSRRSLLESVDYDSPAAYPPGIFQKGKRRLITWLSAYNKSLIRNFMSKELHLDTGSGDGEYDYAVIGSDEVFNHSRGISLQLHGDVPQAKQVISCAASCGSAIAEDILPEHREQVEQALKNFRVVSVRDSATQRYVSALGVQETIRHLDPVLTGRLYAREHRPVKLKNYLLVYAYGQRIRTKEEIDTIRQFAKKRGLKTVAVGGSQFWCDLYIPAHPFRVLDYFFHADYIVTDTFHGCVFSVINHGQFAAIPRRTNTEKLRSLLEDLGLTGRLVSDMDQLERILPERIDYDSVERILQQERKKTREYLKEQLRG